MDERRGDEMNMAYEYDTMERENSGSAFLMGLLAGTVLGAGLGLLFAPKPGSEMRHQISDAAGRLQQGATETYRDASDRVSRMVDRGREAYARACNSAAEAGSRIGRKASDLGAEGRDITSA